MQDTECLKPKTDKKQSLSKQLHLGEPVVIQEEQETIQQTSELNVTTPLQKAADERQIPKADKRAAKKSITPQTVKHKSSGTRKYIPLCRQQPVTNSLDPLKWSAEHVRMSECQTL